MKTLRLSTALLASTCLWASYPVPITDTLTSIDSSKWTQIGSLSSGSNGVTGNGSLISNVAASIGSDYDVRMTIHTVNQGACTGSYSLYGRSTPDNSTSYALTVNGGAIGLFKKVANSWTALSWLPYSCSDGTVLRLLVRGGDITMWSGPNSATYHDPNPIASGHPGVGISSNDTIGNVQLGTVDYIAPPAINPAAVSISTAPHRVDLRWPAGTDDPNGIGLAGYIVYRDGVYLGSPLTPAWLDETVSPGVAVSYTLYAVDQHGNVSAPAVVSVATPAGVSGPRSIAESRLITDQPRTASGPQVDQRRVGVRPTGAYWGAAGEQIDLLSGNLNFSVPLFTAVARGNWSVTFALSYNSQMWREDSGGIWLLGEDTGFGLGWKIQAGSIRPVWYNGAVLYYVYSDSTGAEYVLDQNNGGVWSSLEGVYVYFDANTDILHFTDGTFWTMTVQSAAGEQDAGTLYPSILEDSNGNYVQVQYQGQSSRITDVSDTRGQVGHSFWYNGAHLSNIYDYIGTGASYMFYTSSQALLEPFTSTQFASSVTLLNSVAVNGLNISHQFQYANGTGEMTQLTTPLGGQLNWAYRTFNYTSRSYREVQTRYMTAVPGGTQYSWNINLDSNPNWHASAAVADNGTNTQKAWTFSTASDTTAGLATSYEERDTSGAALLHKDFTWTLEHAEVGCSGLCNYTSGAPYVGTAVTRLNPSSYNAQTKAVQVLDAYGNLV